MFSTNINKRNIKISELGGADNFYDIWKYYFLDVNISLKHYKGLYIN